MPTHRLIFGWIDYTLFSSLLGLSLLIGVYFGFFSKQNTTLEYLFGGKTMHYIPISMSILASLVSGITFLGIPTEVYLHGSQYFAAILSALLICLISVYVTLPVLFDLQVSSCYQYLELRFSKNACTLASYLYIIALLCYIPVVVYGPALALSQVTGYNIHVLTPVISIVCITYTSMGGVKAVVWTDTLQFIFTIAGLITVLILGLRSIGGILEVWNISEQGGRIILLNMNPSPLKRDTFWAFSIGLTITMLARFGLGQKFVQRFLAIKEKSDMNKAISIVSFGWAVLQVGCIFTGLLSYATYHGCDPVKAKLIDRSDQILPYYVMDIAGHLSGLPGVFLAGLVSSGLSTMSASLNTLSATIYETFIDQLIPESPKKDAKAAHIMKVLSVFLGIITIGLVFVAEQFGTVFEMAFSLSTAAEGALLGLLLLGFLFPWVGQIGALTGAYTSLFIMLWYVGTIQWLAFNKRLRVASLPTSVADCPTDLNVTFAHFESEVTSSTFSMSEDAPSSIFHIAVVYYIVIGCLITILMACITSYFVGEMNLLKVDPRHVSPIVRRFLPQRKIYNQIPLREINTPRTEICKKSEMLISH